MFLAADGIFNVDGLQQQDGQLTATLAVDGRHEIFKGHFPGQPVVPGACMLALVKEVMEHALNTRLQLKNAGNIKFMQMIIPAGAVALQLTVTYPPPLANSISLTAFIANAETVCFKLQAVFSLL